MIQGKPGFHSDKLLVGGWGTMRSGAGMLSVGLIEAHALELGDRHDDGFHFRRGGIVVRAAMSVQKRQ